MCAMGLSGKSFVPMLIGFGCNVPSVMAARTLESSRERIITIMMSPFMSCGARLAIYAVFTSVFFPRHGAAVIFLLYVVGLLMAMLTGLILRKTLLPGQPHPMVLELPAYQWPSFSMVSRQMWRRLRGFILRAGRLIIPVCVLMGVLNIVQLPNDLLPTSSASSTSLLAYLGQWVTPLFAPMGIQPDNWPATIGLLTGVLAKEVVIGSLNTLYSSGSSIADAATHLLASHQVSSISAQLYASLLSIKTNLMQLPSALWNPLTLATSSVEPLSSSMYHRMMQAFDGPVGALAYLLFILLYFPCVSTMAVTARELNYRWACFSITWNTFLAYAIAVSYYQMATFFAHPLSSILWLIGMWGVLVGVLIVLRCCGSRLSASLFIADAKNGVENLLSRCESQCVSRCKGCFAQPTSSVSL